MSAARGRVVLASASPRRRALLARAGLEFEVEPADVDESLPAQTDPVLGARILAERKAGTVAARCGGPAWVLGADTVVALPAPQGAAGWRLLGKPGSAGEAAGMLAALSGARHLVVTGLCVVRAPELETFRDSESTWVTMRALAPREIADYVASLEWRDKAGGYAIQESAERFVTALEGGGLDNVVGLPVARSLALLRAAGFPRRLVGGRGPS